MIENLYELVGGHETTEAATKRICEKILEDNSLRHFFQGTDMANLRSRQVMFISTLLGGRVYTGKDIHGAHARTRDHGLSERILTCSSSTFALAWRKWESSRKMARKS